MKKVINYYMNHIYPIDIAKISDKEGGGFSVSIPQLGRNVFLSDGETLEEALKNLDLIKEDWFTYCFEHGIPIPEPVKEVEEDY